MGRAALCSCPAQSALGELLLFTSYKSYYSPTSLFCHPFQLKIQRRGGGLQPIPPHPQRGGNGFPSGAFCSWFQWVSSHPSFIGRPPHPLPWTRKRVGFVIACPQKLLELHKGTSDHFQATSAGDRELSSSRMSQYKGPKHQGPGDAWKCPRHSLPQRSPWLPNHGEVQIGESLPASRILPPQHRRPP